MSSKKFYHRYLTWFVNTPLSYYDSICYYKIQMTTRSNHQRCSARKGVLRNFSKFIGKHLRQVLFYNKVAGLEPATLLKMRLWRRCFPINFAKFLRTTFHRTPLNDCYSTAENPSKVLNGQQQHKGVTFHWSRVNSSLVKLF